MCLSLLYTDLLHSLEKSCIGTAWFEHIYELWNGLTNHLPNSSSREAAPQGRMSWEQQMLTAQAVPFLTRCNTAGPKKGKTGHGNPSTVLDKVRWWAWAGVLVSIQEVCSETVEIRTEHRKIRNSAQTRLECSSPTALSPNRFSGPTGRECLSGGPGEVRQGS